MDKNNRNNNKFRGNFINSTKRFNRVKKPSKFVRMLAVGLMILTAGSSLYKIGNDKVKNYIYENPTYASSVVDSNISFYGGDTRYITINKNLLGLGLDKLYNHIDLNGDDSISISYDDKVSFDKREQFQYTFDYLNEVFGIVNPNIKFEVVDLPKKDADIYIQMKSLKKDVGMKVEWDVDPINRSKVLGGVISVNKDVQFSNTELKFYMLHEMFHILTGSEDVNEKESPTFSIFNYEDVGFINYQIENSYPSAEAQKAAIETGDVYHVFPVMSDELKKSYVTLLPTDLGTIIALYGDSSDPEKKQAYIGLLIDTVDECKLIFGNQPYFSNKNVLENLNAELEKLNKNEKTAESEKGMGE